MLKNYFLTTFRSIIKHRLFTVINVIGLAIGIACCILILLYVSDEISYDRYHENAERIYRAGIDGRMGDREFMTYTTAAPFARAVVDDFPEVVNACRFDEGINKLVTVGDKNFIEDGVYYCDSTVFEIFSWNLLKGNPETALVAPNSIVFTESMAKKYFGDDDPMDKTVTFDNDTEFKVTGVMEDVPHNSHFHFDFLGSLNTYEYSKRQNWLSDNFATYFIFDKDADIEAFKPKLRDVILKYVGPQVEAGLGVSLEEWESTGNRYGYFIEPLTGIYLNSVAIFYMEPLGDKKYVIIFSIVAVFILTIACVNFMNLTTAKASTRAKEVGLRKVVGARRRQLIFQFLSESALLSIIAMVIAIIGVHLLLPSFNQLTQKELAIEYFQSPWFIPGLIGLIIFTALFAGSYSSFSLASFKITTVIKGKLQSGKKGAWFRSGLVVFQFAISIGIVIATLVVNNQLTYMQNKDLGFEKENVLVVERPYAMGDQIDAFKEEVLKFPGIQTCGVGSSVPGKGFNGNVYHKEGGPSEDMVHFQTITGDFDFADAMKFNIKEGRFFSNEFLGDTNCVVINESGVKALGYEEPIGRSLVGYGDDQTDEYFKIIGVVEDFHTMSMHERIPNVVFRFPAYYSRRYLVVKITDNLNQNIKNIESLWKEFLPQQPFDYFFMDDHFNSLHKAETRTGNVLGIFSLLALFIAALGLFGLSTFISEQRTKEIGIRKVMGSTVSGILILLSKQFTRWVILANLIAWPVVYYFMHGWLQNFIYRTNIAPWVFVITALVSIALALITVSYQSARAATTNPVNSLRYE